MPTTRTHPDQPAIRPEFRHLAACETRTIGLVVQQLLTADDTVTITRDGIAHTVALAREVGFLCDCANLRLAHAEGRLRLARAAVRAWRLKHPHEEVNYRVLTYRVTSLMAERDDALKAAK